MNSWIGSLHSHTSFSAGAGAPVEAYAHARDVAQMDFWGVSDHVWHPSSERDGITASEIAQMRGSAEAISEDGRFIAFWGYEWTTTGEHAVIWGDEYIDQTTDINALLSRVQERGGLVNLSHLWLGLDPLEWARRHHVFLPRWNQAVAIVDCFPPPNYRCVFEELVGQGYRVGAFAGQDNHAPDWGEMGGFTGWGVIWAPRRTRESLESGIRACRVAATRERDLRPMIAINGAEMGSEAVLRASTGMNLSWNLGNADVGGLIIEILRNGIQHAVTNAERRSMAIGGAQLGREAWHIRAWRPGQSQPVAVSSPVWIVGK